MAASVEDNSALNVTFTKPEAPVIEKEFSNVLSEGSTLAALTPPGIFTVPSTWPNSPPTAGKLAELWPLAKGTLADALALTELVWNWEFKPPLLLLTDTNAESVQGPDHIMEPDEGVALKLFKSRLPDALVNPLAGNGCANRNVSPTEITNQAIPRLALQ